MKRPILRPAILVFAVLDMVVLGVVLAGWESFTKTPLTTRTELTILALYAAITVLREVRRSYEEVSSEPALAEKPEKRVFVEDPEVVLEIAKLTGYEAIRRFTPYLGKWMTISGIYEGDTESLGRDPIHLTLLLNDGRRVNLRFAKEHGERLRELKQGQRITAMCRIQHGPYCVLVLENCELIRAEPLRRTERTGLVYTS